MPGPGKSADCKRFVRIVSRSLTERAGKIASIEDESSVFWWWMTIPKSSVPSPSCWKKRAIRCSRPTMAWSAGAGGKPRPAADHHRRDDAKAGRAFGGDENPGKRNRPLLLCSAQSEDSDSVLGLSMGADDYIAKPFHPQELVARCASSALYPTGRRERPEPGRRGSSTADSNARAMGAAGGRGAGVADGHGAENRGLLMRNLGRPFQPRRFHRRVAGTRSYAREHRHGTHTAHSGKDRAQSKGTGISEGGVGHWIQIEALSPPGLSGFRAGRHAAGLQCGGGCD